jgi:5'-phosphate synthase pdxT subunit
MSRRSIGVLALQGGHRPHVGALGDIGRDAIEVRSKADLDRCGGLVLAGGESTTQRKLIESAGLDGPIRAFVRERPVLATCAGLILLASWGALDVDVERNAYGSQVDSFEAVSDRGHPLVFIRAPRIRRAGDRVEILDTLAGEPVTIREGSIVAACHHSELTPDRWLHEHAFGMT